jgi:hypothetical protein
LYIFSFSSFFLTFFFFIHFILISLGTVSSFGTAISVDF